LHNACRANLPIIDWTTLDQGVVQEVSSLSSIEKILPVSISMVRTPAGAAFDVGKPGIDARLNSGDAQALVVIDGSVLVVALIETEEASARGPDRILQPEHEQIGVRA